MKKRLTTKEAAQLIDAPEQLLRVMLQQGGVSWGVALKRSSRYTYYINAAKFCEEYRIKEEDLLFKS